MTADRHAITAASGPAVAVIGAGPAGLMAAEVLATAGRRVEVFDAMPSVARKFLLAGVGGMNITHAEDYDTFVTRYGTGRADLQSILDDFPPEQLRAWIHGLGIDTFVGTSGRVFPREMKAAPLLRAWLHRLRSRGVIFHPRHRWTGWPDHNPALGWRFSSPTSEQSRRFDAVVLALGGASWPRLGSDGSWVSLLAGQGVAVRPLRPSNCGFRLHWSDHLRERFAGTPLKNVALSLTIPSEDPIRRKGELVVTDYGIEGSLVYALSGPLRDHLDRPGTALTLDWLPERSPEWIRDRLASARKGTSFANLLRKQLRLPAVASALLRDCCPALDRSDPTAISAALKAMPLAVEGPRPIAEAISSAGGIAFDAVDEGLMLRALPGVFAAGEMLDWEAPTGGYLLTACLATGYRAGTAAHRWLMVHTQR